MICLGVLLFQGWVLWFLIPLELFQLRLFGYKVSDRVKYSKVLLKDFLNNGWGLGLLPKSYVFCVVS